MFQAISRTFLQQNDFISLEKYLKKTYKDFIKHNIFNKNNHEQKLMMLTYLTNSLYKNGKMSESLLVAEELNRAMNDFDAFLKNQFLFYYYNALVINYSNLDKKKALEILNKAKKNKIIQSLPVFGSFIYLNTGLIYYDQKKYKIAIKHFSRLILQTDFVSLSSSLQLKILIAELIIRHQLKQTDIIYEKVRKIKKQYKKELTENNRDLQILLIIEKLIYCANIYVDKKLQEEIERIKIPSLNENAENTDIINYNNWLTSIYK